MRIYIFVIYQDLATQSQSRKESAYLGL